MTELSNTPFQDIKIGDSAEYSKQVTRHDLELFAKTSGDVNPIHLDDEYAKSTEFGECIAHGMWSGALISAALATKLPGPGSIYRSQTLKFLKPAKINDVLTVKLEVSAIKERIKLVTLDCTVTNQDGVKIATGTAEAIATDQSITVTAPTLD